MKCEKSDCENIIDKSNCIVSGVREDTYWCSEECYQDHINCRRKVVNLAGDVPK